MSTTYMNLALPTPSVTDGPQWATDNNTALETIDAHDHTSGKGVQVPSAGLNINADLSFGSYAITEVKSVNLDSQVASLSAASVRAIYSVNDDLYYNNGSGTPVQITQGTSIASASSPLVPTGVIFPYGGSSAPTGFLMCNGSNVSRSTYADLFAAIGTSFGVGDGSTTFTLPDMRGRVPMGVGTYTDSVSGSLTRTLGQTVGAAAHTLTSAEMPSHTHTDSGHTHVERGYGGGGGTAQILINTAAGSPGPDSSSTTTASGNANIQATGGGATHNNMQPSLGLNYIIKT